MFTFHAMDTRVEVTTWADDEATAAEVAATFADAESRFSRFRADSELSRLNRAEGPFKASPRLFDMLVRARAYLEMTDGLFDPGVGATLRALGYDRSFATGPLDRERVSAPPRRGTLRDVVLERDTRRVWRPWHVQIDLGGMAKGAAVDGAALHLRGWGAIDAGGDAVMRGTDSAGDGWLVDIEHPSEPSRTVATLAVSDAAVATSAPNRRRWRVGEGFAHHLIDPRTHGCSDSDLLQATVVAADTERADVFAKTAFLLGAREGRRFIERQSGIGAVLVPKSGGVIFAGVLDVREVSRA